MYGQPCTQSDLKLHIDMARNARSTKLTSNQAPDLLTVLGICAATALSMTVCCTRLLLLLLLELLTMHLLRHA